MTTRILGLFLAIVGIIMFALTLEFTPPTQAGFAAMIVLAAGLTLIGSGAVCGLMGED